MLIVVHLKTRSSFVFIETLCVSCLISLLLTQLPHENNSLSFFFQTLLFPRACLPNFANFTSFYCLFSCVLLFSLGSASICVCGCVVMCYYNFCSGSLFSSCPDVIFFYSYSSAFFQFFFYLFFKFLFKYFFRFFSFSSFNIYLLFLGL